MAVQVLDSKDQAEAVTTGVIPVPKEVAADNAAMRGEKPAEKPAETETTDTPNGEKPALKAVVDPDDEEGEDGLTPRQKRDLTKKMQSSIGKKHRQLKEAEEFAAEQYNEKRLAEARAAELERENQRLKNQGQQPAQPVNDGTDRPLPQNFATQEEYFEAVTNWRVNEILKERDRDAEAKVAQARQKEVTDAAVARLEHARATVPDFQEVTESVDTLVPPHIGAAMFESDKFAELGYYFAKNPSELEKIAAMPQAKGLVALGRIEAIIKPFAAPKAEKSNGSKPSQDGSTPSTETGASQTSPSKPRAAAPITPLSTSSNAQVDAVDSGNIRQSIDKFVRDRNVNILNRKRH